MAQPASIGEHDATAGPSGALSPAANVLMRLCACPDADFDHLFPALQKNDWRELVERAIGKRVALVLDHALNRSKAIDLLPGDCAEALNAERRRMSMSAFGHMIALHEAIGFLDGEGIAAIALKGVRLAYRDYPDPRMRPLRDIDLLVSAAHAERAQRMMIESGTYQLAPWAEHYGIEFGHQLPELLDRRHGVSFEIHHRLNARGWADEPKLVNMVLRDAEEIDISGKRVLVPSMHANFLHLVEHATLHHLFENGPITLVDLHFAARSGQIDWPLLIAQARDMGLERALQLVAAIALSHGACWVPAELAQHATSALPRVPVCTAVLLREDDLNDHAAMLRRLSMSKDTAPDWKAALRAAINPTPLKLAGIMRVSGNNPLRWLAYPVWLFRRAAAYRAARRARIDATSTIAEVAALRWLQERVSP